MNPNNWPDAARADASLKSDLQSLAERITLDSAFQAALENRLQRAHHPQINAEVSGWRRILSWTSLRPRLALGLTLALLLTLLLGIPVLAQMGLLKYFVPYEVTQYPTRPALVFPFEPLTAPSLASLEQAVGFPLLVPIYLPGDCPIWQYAYVKPSAAFITYTCVDILEQKAVADWRNNPLRQPVGPNAVANLTINGQPAYYIEGTWQFETMRSGTPTPPVWVPTGARRLVLERGDLLLDLAAMPASLQNGIPSGLISREELIRIAESMR